MDLWSGKRDLNPRQSRWQREALPAELFPHKFYFTTHKGFVNKKFHQLVSSMREIEEIRDWGMLECWDCVWDWGNPNQRFGTGRGASQKCVPTQSMGTRGGVEHGSEGTIQHAGTSKQNQFHMRPRKMRAPVTIRDHT